MHGKIARDVETRIKTYTPDLWSSFYSLFFEWNIPIIIMFVCEMCSKSFTKSCNLKRHQNERVCCKITGSAGSSSIKPRNLASRDDAGPSCKTPTKRSKNGESPANKYCSVCDEILAPSRFIGHMRSGKHSRRCGTSTLEKGILQLHTAFKCRIASYRVSPTKFHISIVEFMGELKNKILRLLEDNVRRLTSLKINLELFGLYTKEPSAEQDVKSFITANEVVARGTDLARLYETLTEVLDRKASEFQERGSGFALMHLLYIEVNLNKFNPLRASSYIQLPEPVMKKNAVVNVKNQDEFCFGWAVTSAIFTPNGPSDRTESYPNWRTVLDFGNIPFPVRIRDVSKFESYNPRLSIHVYGLEKSFKAGGLKYEVVGPLYYSPHTDRVHINLLLICDEEGNSHYCWIKDLSRLVSQQLTKRDGAKYLCQGCLQYFRSHKQLDRHLKFDCNHVSTKLPTTELELDWWGESKPNNILKFESFQKQLEVPFVVYADFETLLSPVSTADAEVPNLTKPFTVTTCEHKPYSFAYYIKCNFDDRLSKFELYRGNDAVDVFVQCLENDIRTIYSTSLKHIVPITPLGPADVQKFVGATTCHICDRPFVDGGDFKVRDHNHLTGKFEGAAHARCNLNYQIPSFVPVFFHNLNYDAHLFVKQLALNNEELNVIPQTKEKYISFGKRLLVDEITENGKVTPVYLEIRFLDSYRFLAASLASLADTLSDDQCVEIRNRFGNGVKFELMRQKGVFPYSYVDSFQKLNDPALPSRDLFYDPLTDSQISPDDYQRAERVWNTFGCNTLGEYSNVYLECDVFLLADVFQNFRQVCLQQYRLDPAQYYTAPGLSWQAMLRFTGVELELLTDVDLLHFFRHGIRGGVSTCIKRVAEANNQFAENYDPSKPKSFILYTDCTNLYGYAMTRPLPLRDFVWLTDEEIKNFDVFTVDDDSDTGYVLEVDLHYPPDLHVTHNDFPFCPELLVPPTAKFDQKKLIPNLNDKHQYVIHYTNLKQCLRAGLVLTKTHRIVKFIQCPWLRPYIDLNTKLRNNSTNDFHRSLFKLLNNSVFGKTMENVDKRVLVKLVSHWNNIGKRQGAEALIAKPNFKDRVRFTESLIAVELKRTSVFYNKPSYVGFSVLDISKTVMYEFFYDFLKPFYGANVSLLYTDTDSFVLQIDTDNVYDDIKLHLDRFDTSNYKNNLHSMPRTESVVGKFKDEYAGVVIRSFYGTGAKTYCVNAGDMTDMKAKGVKKSAVRKYLTSALYRTVALNQCESVYCQMYVFRSRLHTMYTDLMNKVALSSHDDKRYVIPGCTSTLAWGHLNIPDTNKLHDDDDNLLL